ncbi:ParB/RepB/Spo0J family partition protein [Phycicoccus jejuensis]|uniref:ParB/RepB/Spo0J family partition protein n=1 Tax=Phycicoccus jejuensis TaxID=367299 RepID=UPI0004C43314|nr:ParB/RepB/Spo0J family partition protein [Phycicoccus jejuensis]
MAGNVTLRGVPIGDLVANAANVRDDATVDVEDLAASIRVQGILQPLIVNETGGRLVVTDGHRRLAAARLAQVPVLPCLVTTGRGKRDVVATMLATAMHKELTPLEQARAFRQLRNEGMVSVDIARATGYSAALVKARLLLLELPREAQDMVEDSTLTLRDATTLAKQVKAKRTGTVGTNAGRSAWFTRSHPLAASITCDHGDRRTIVGAVACGQCWEETIRAHERGELDVVPTHDETAVVRVLSGDLPEVLSRADRLEVVRRLVAQGASDHQIARRTGVTERQALRDRQHLDLASPIGVGGHPEVRAG